MNKIRQFRTTVRQYDWILIGATVLLVTMGLVSIFSTGYPDLEFFSKQLIWLVLGLGLLIAFGFIDYRLFRVHFSPVLFLYVVGVLGLLAVHFFGTPIRGARSWIVLGPLNIEPVEALKIVLVLILAKYFSMRHVEMYRVRHIVISGLYVAIPAALVFVQPDFGSFLVLALLWVGLMMIAGIKVKHVAVLGLVAVMIAVFAWSFLLLDYQKARVLTFLNPEQDPFGAGYNSIQATIATGSGGLWGKGFMQGTQSQLDFLPEPHTDFIYAALTEELGVAIAWAVLALYGVVVWRMMTALKRAPDNFARLSIAGFVILIVAQTSLNIAMTLGLLPITGLTLPFVSYGGSSLLTLFVAVGITQSIWRQSSVEGGYGG